MWQFEGSCTTEDAETFTSGVKSKIEKAQGICATCPVTDQCFDFATDPDNEITWGVWAGFWMGPS